MQRAYRLRILAVALALAAVLGSGCFEFNEIAVENAAPEPFYADTWSPCHPPLRESRLRKVDPGKRTALPVLSGRWFSDEWCLKITTAGDRPRSFRAGSRVLPVEAGGLYRVEVRDGGLEIRRDGDYQDARHFDFNRPPLWSLIVFGGPFALEGLFAAFITLQFFYRYYVRHSI